MYTLVTGGAGFIGTHLIRTLLIESPNVKIVSLDDYSTGKESNHINGVQYVNGRTQDALEPIAARNIVMRCHAHRIRNHDPVAN